MRCSQVHQSTKLVVVQCVSCWLCCFAVLYRGMGWVSLQCARSAHAVPTQCPRSANTLPEINAQGDHEERAPNVADAEQAIGIHPPSLHNVPARARAAPRAPGGARHGGGNRIVTSPCARDKRT